SAFTHQLRQAKNPALQSFDLAVLRIKDDSCFEVVAPNNLQLKFIESERIRVSEYLQQEFCNRALTFSIIIEEQLDLSEKIDLPLSTREQFTKIAEEYPLVKELKDRLRLELDY
ncbi:MAG TPA: DNA polymerase III subunit gamma/tau, partial [Chitinophagaceae bacterium]